MGTALATVLACMCLPAYLPLLILSIRQLFRGEVVLTRWSFLNIRVTRLTGRAAFVYNIAQVLSALLILNGALSAVGAGNPFLIFTGLITGWIIGLVGGFLARMMQGDVSEYNVAPNVYTRFSDGETVYTRYTKPDGSTEEHRYLVDHDSQPDFSSEDITDAEYRDVGRDNDDDETQGQDQRT